MTEERWTTLRRHICFIDPKGAATTGSHRDDTHRIPQMQSALDEIYATSLQIFSTEDGRISLDDDLIGTLSNTNPKHSRKQNKVSE